MNPLDLPKKADAMDRAGYRDLARHLRRLAWSLGVRFPAREPESIELPALRGFRASDLNALGMPWRRTPDGVLVSLKGGPR